MKRIKSTIVLFFAVVTMQNAYSQNNETKPEYGIKFNGYVKTAAYYDSRQMVSFREGYLHLYPMNEQLDSNGNDLNARGSFNILSIESRLKGVITAPDAFGAKTSGVLEGEFLGSTNASINTLRLRHAFLKLNWTNTELLIGQYWSPLLNPDACPGTISFNTGMTFQPFSRNPQIKFSHKFGIVNLIGVLASERDMTSYGPSGASSNYLQYSKLPLMHFQFQLKSNEHLLAFGVSYKKLIPETQIKVKNKLHKTDASIGSTDFMTLLKVKLEPITITAQSIYSQNGSSMFLLGGFATNKLDSATGEKTYTNIESLSGWIDLKTNSKKMQLGLFCGYSKNLGSNKDIVFSEVYTNTTMTNSSKIEYVYRVAPRLMYIYNKVTFALEYDYSVAAYGTIDSKAKVKDSKEISNNRILFTAALNF